MRGFEGFDNDYYFAASVGHPQPLPEIPDHRFKAAGIDQALWLTESLTRAAAPGPGERRAFCLGYQIPASGQESHAAGADIGRLHFAAFDIFMLIESAPLSESASQALAVPDQYQPTINPLSLSIHVPNEEHHME